MRHTAFNDDTFPMHSSPSRTSDTHTQPGFPWPFANDGHWNTATSSTVTSLAPSYSLPLPHMLNNSMAEQTGSDSIRSLSPSMSSVSPLSDFSLTSVKSSSVSDSGLADQKCANPRTRPRDRKRDPDRLPRPPNAFMLYRSQFHKDKKIPPEVENLQCRLSGIIAKCWKKLPPDERQKWFAKAQEVHTEHMKKYPHYKFTPRPKRSKVPCAQVEPMNDEEQLQRLVDYAHNKKATAVSPPPQTSAAGKTGRNPRMSSPSRASSTPYPTQSSSSVAPLHITPLLDCTSPPTVPQVNIPALDSADGMRALLNSLPDSPPGIGAPPPFGVWDSWGNGAIPPSQYVTNVAHFTPDTTIVKLSPFPDRLFHISSMTSMSTAFGMSSQPPDTQASIPQSLSYTDFLGAAGIDMPAMPMHTPSQTFRGSLRFAPTAFMYSPPPFAVDHPSFFPDMASLSVLTDPVPQPIDLNALVLPVDVAHYRF